MGSDRREIPQGESNNSSFEGNNNRVNIPQKILNHLFSSTLRVDRGRFLDLRREADKGSTSAQFELGSLIYRCGEDIRYSYYVAFDYFQLAAAKGHRESLFFLAVMYHDGVGTEDNIEQAFYYYQLAAAQNHTDALLELGKFYELGAYFVEKSPTKAIYCYETAGELGNYLGWKCLAEAYEKGICGETSIEKIESYKRQAFLQAKKHADEGCAAAQVDVGSFFEKGLGVEESMESAFNYYKMSAEQGFLGGLYNLAGCFAEGKGVQKSPEMAIHYYKLAADGGDACSQYGLASYLLKNKIDDTKAIHYLNLVIQNEKINRKSNTRLLALSEYELGNCFEQGLGVEKSAQNALYYYKRAFDKGYSCAQIRLAEAHLKGQLGIEKSPETAFNYYHLAAAQGSSYALNMIAQFYEKGEGVEQSLEKAFEYYQSAVQTGLEKCLGYTSYELARCYQKGVGTEKSLEKAIYNYKLSAENGMGEGYYQAGLCYKELGGQENAEKAVAYFKMAVATNSPGATLELAEAYKKGYGVEKSQVESDKYSQLAKVQSWQLKKDFEEFKKDEKKYFEFLKMAADQGETIVQFFVAEYYEKSVGVEKSPENAFAYYKMLADKGFISGQCKVGSFYAQGIGVKQSFEQAFIYYSLAVYNKEEHPDIKGCAELEMQEEEARKSAMYFLAKCYEEGLGCEKSDEKAADLKESLNKAERGNKDKKQLQVGSKELQPDKSKRKINAKKIKIKSISQALPEIMSCIEPSRLNTVQAQIPQEAIFYPDSKKLDIAEYTKDTNYETLKNIFKQSKHSAIYLEASGLDEKEIEIVRDAMIENQKFTFICTKDDLEKLVQSFVISGYKPQSCIKYCKFLDKDSYGVIFSGRNWNSNSKGKIKDDGSLPGWYYGLS